MTITTITPDTDLLRQMRRGTAAAFQALYRRHQGPLFRFALLRSGSADTAADIVQEVFMGLLTDSLRFDPLRGELRAFLFGVVRNLLLKHEEPRLRHASLSEPDEEGELGFDSGSEAAEPLARMLDNEVAEDVRRALSLLPPTATSSSCTSCTTCPIWRWPPFARSTSARCVHACRAAGPRWRNDWRHIAPP